MVNQVGPQWTQRLPILCTLYHVLYFFFLGRSEPEKIEYSKRETAEI